MDPKSATEAVLEFRDDYVGLDGFLFPDEPPLVSHQRYKYRKYPTRRFRWDEESRGAGKSYAAARLCLVDGIRRADRTFIFSGPSYRQSKHPFHYALRLIEGSPWLRGELARRPLENNERAEIALKNGTRFVALPASGDLIHGERGTDLVLTEFFAYPKELYLRTVMPMMAVRRGRWPNTLTIETAAGFQHQFAYEERERWLKLIAGGDPERFFVSVDLDDLRETDYPIDWEMVESSRVADDDIWLQQYMNVWLALSGNFYEYGVLSSEELKTGPALRSAREGKTYVAGGDVARVKGGDDSTFAVWEADRSGSFPPALIYLEVWNGKTAEFLAGEWARLINRFRVASFVVDFRGGGRNVVDVLRERYGILEVDDDSPLLGRRIILAAPGMPEAINDMHYGFRSAAEDRRVAFPAEPKREDTQLRQIYNLVDVAVKQLCDLKTTPLPTSGWMKFAQPSGKKKDVAYATVYGHWGVRQMLRTYDPPPAKPRGDPIIESELSKILVMGDRFLGPT